MSTGLHNYGGEFVYRLLRPDESPYKDIVCKDLHSNLTISQHVKEGLKIPTQFISTTASFQTAKDWIDTSHACRPSEYSHLERRNTIVKISVKYIRDRYPAVANSAYNFTDENFRCKHLFGIESSYARRYEEIDFERTIPKEAITDIHVVGKGWIGLIPPVATTPAPLPVATPDNTCTNSSTSSVGSLPFFSPSPQLNLQSLPPSLSSTSSSTGSLITSQVATPASTVANTGIKRKLSSEDYVPPSKCKRNEEQVSGSEWLSVCLVGK